jgi:hypothetical protein
MQARACVKPEFLLAVELLSLHARSAAVWSDLLYTPCAVPGLGCS